MCGGGEGGLSHTYFAFWRPHGDGGGPGDFLVRRAGIAKHCKSPDLQ